MTKTDSEKEYKDQKKILFFYLTPSSFVNSDRELLGELYNVKEFQFFLNSASNVVIPLRWISQILFLTRHIKKSDVIFGWFVDYHLMFPALFSLIFRKPLVAVMGGTDAMNIQEWKHGVFASWWRAPIAKFIYKRTDLLLPVSETLIHSFNSYTYYPEKKEFGLAKELKSIRAKVTPLPTGYDESVWRLTKVNRDLIVTTVAFVNSKKRVWIKGLDVFVETAKKMPEATFQIVGIKEDQKHLLGENLPQNLNIVGPKSTAELVEIYNLSSVYVQLSRIEGLPNVLCEAMLCGCIPIGSNIFGISEVITNSENLVNSYDAEVVAEKIIKAHKNASPEKRYKIRDSICEGYSIIKRKGVIKSVLDELKSS